jgi:hypothetical protein
MYRFTWAILTLLLSIAFHAEAMTEDTFDVLQTGTQTYTNVTVTTKAKNYIFVLHSTGMANIKLSELTEEQRVKLGYPAELDDGKRGFAKAWKKKGLAKMQLPQVQEAEKRLKQQFDEIYGPIVSRISCLSPTATYAGVAVLVFVFLFFSYCGHLICVKAGAPSGLLIWLPLFQVIPLLRAARMSAAWFLAYFLILPGLLAQLVWCVKISKARSKGAWTSIFLMLPLTAPLAFLYLAFSGAESPSSSVSNPRLMAFETI